VLANIPYLTLAGAARVGIPAVAFSSLNWAEIYAHYYTGRPEAGRILDQMVEAYNSAQCFLKATPSMAMPGIANGHSVGPIAQVANCRSNELRKRIGLRGDERIVLFSLGGMDLNVSAHHWPPIPGWHSIVPEAWQPGESATAFERLRMPFTEVFSCCDVLVTKPGYGSFVEAACAAKPVLYLDRGDWPEIPFLVSWLEENGYCRPIDRADLKSGNLMGYLREVSGIELEPVQPTGVDEAADYITNLLRTRYPA
jgi:hypothetical protein